MIIDNTYFDFEPKYVPNNKDISAEPEGAPSVQSTLDHFIDTCERQLLLEALGVTLYNELKTASENLPYTGKWLDLVEGKDYTIGDKTYRWDGLEGYNKQSPIAYYVFCEYLKSDLYTYSTTGVIKNVADNAIDAGFDTVHRLNWSKFRELYQKKEIGVISSLYQYLCDMNELDPTSFPDFNFRFYGSRNEFGI